MDTSRDYIKMCERTPNEMKQKFHGQTDWYVYIKSGFLEKVFIFGDVALQNRKFDIIFPVFRQDQLQEMVKDKFGTISNLCFSFYTFLGMRHQGNVYKFSSMEQLWLAFVMEERYNKVWDGKEWVKNENQN